jgi:hypothetical protein
MGISLSSKKSKTDPAGGIAMGALAMLPSNKCDPHETFHDWSIPLYTTAFLLGTFLLGTSNNISTKRMGDPLQTILAHLEPNDHQGSTAHLV